MIKLKDVFRLPSSVFRLPSSVLTQLKVKSKHLYLKAKRDDKTPRLRTIKLLTPHSSLFTTHYSLLTIICLLLICSCDLFNAPQQSDYYAKIDEEIVWAHADRLTVTVSIPPLWGSSLHSGTNRCFDDIQTTQTPRKGYPFTVEFTPDLAYSLDHWRAYLTSSMPENWTSDPSLLDTVDRIDGSLVSVPAGLSARGGSGSFTVNTPLPVTLVPWCKTEPYILRTTPRHSPDTLYPRGTDIIIYFNAPLALTPDVNLPSLFTSGAIVITAKDAGGSSGELISANNDYYNYPVYTASVDRAEYKITISAADVPGDSLIEVTVGPDIFNTSNVPMAEKEVFSFSTSPATGSGNILSWGAEYTGSSINVNWTNDPTVEVIGRYRVNQGGDNELLNKTIPNVTLPNFTNVRQGGEITGIREYEIFLDLYVEGIKSNAGSRSFKIWNIPEMSVSNLATNPEVIEIRTQAEFNAIGTPTTSNPSYGLGLVNANKKYVLANDITLTSWTPIGDSSNSFQGKFYGNGHTVTISGMNAAANMGLFGVVDNAVIRDLTVSANITIPANSTTVSFGCVAGCANGSTEIRNIVTRGSVTSGVLSAGGEKYIGGVAGYMANGGSISNCYVDIDLSASVSTSDISFGGIAGHIPAGGSGTCIDTVRVPGRLNLTANSAGITLYAGGVVGYSAANKTITDANFSGSLTVNRNSASAPSHIGGIAGSVLNSTFSNSSTTGKINIPGTFELIGTTNINIGGLAGSAASMSATGCRASGDIGTSVRVQRTAEVLIGGLVGDCNNSNWSGCRYQDGAIAASVIVTNAGTGENDALFLGGAFGRIRGSSNVNSCYSRATSVKGSVHGWAVAYADADIVNVGGFVGDLDASLSKCFATAEVEAQGYESFAGGLAGRTGPWDTTTSASISSCYATGDVYSKSTGEWAYAGGLIGKTNNLSGFIEHCFAQGNVYSTGPGQTFAGGLIGIMQRLSGSITIQYCYARGSVSAISSNATRYTCVGGLVGNRQGGSIQYCVAVGARVTGINTTPPPSDPPLTNYFGVSRILGTFASGSQSSNRAIDTMIIGWLNPYTSNPNPVYNIRTVSSSLNDLDSVDGLSTSFTDLQSQTNWTDWGFSTTYWNYDVITRGCPELRMD